MKFKFLTRYLLITGALFGMFLSTNVHAEIKVSCAKYLFLTGCLELNTSTNDYRVYVKGDNAYETPRGAKIRVKNLTTGYQTGYVYVPNSVDAGKHYLASFDGKDGCRYQLWLYDKNGKMQDLTLILKS